MQLIAGPRPPLAPWAAPRGPRRAPENTHRLVRSRASGSARGRAELQPGRLCSPVFSTAWFRLILMRFQDETNCGKVWAWQDHAGLIHRWAIYHLMCRGGHREAIFRDDADRRAGKETNEQRAERLVREWLEAEGRSQAELHTRPKGDPKKTQWALRLREETPMTRQWIATRGWPWPAPATSRT